MSELKEELEVITKNIPKITTKTMQYELKETTLPPEILELIELCVSKYVKDNKIMHKTKYDKIIYKLMLPTIGVIFSLLIIISTNILSPNIINILPIFGGLVLAIMNLYIVFIGEKGND